LDAELKNLIALQDYKHRLDEMRTAVQKIVVDDFVSTSVSPLEQLDKSEYDARMRQLIISCVRLGSLGLVGEAFHRTIHDYLALSMNRAIAKLSGQHFEIDSLAESIPIGSPDKASLTEYLMKMSQEQFLVFFKEVASVEKECLFRFERTRSLFFLILEEINAESKEVKESKSGSLSNFADSKMIEALQKQFLDLIGFAAESILSHVANILQARPCVCLFVKVACF
jgi:hypothetical protein